MLLLLLGALSLQHLGAQSCSQWGPAEIVRDYRGTIQSPNFPYDYPNSAFCEWVIELPDSFGTIYGRFAWFNLEYSGKCSFDRVRLYDGGTSNSPLIGTYCGSSVPGAFRTSSNQLFVEFRTDGSVTRSGFKLAFETSDTACSNSARGVTSPGEIMTSLQPFFNYENNMNCQWRISAGENEIVFGYFMEFNTESSYDYLRIYDGSDAYAPMRYSLSGYWRGYTISTSQRNAFLRFTSDYSVQYPGFRLTFMFMRLSAFNARADEIAAANAKVEALSAANARVSALLAADEKGERRSAPNPREPGDA